MKFKSKIVLFVCAFALIFSVLSVSCFAFVQSIEPGVVYTLTQSPVFEDYISGEAYDFDFSGDYIFVVDDVEYSGFVIQNNAFTIYNDTSYFSYSGLTSTWSFTSSGETVELDYPVSFTISVLPSASGVGYRWLLDNLVLVSDNDSFYYSLFSSISDGVFGVGADLTPEQVMTLTLISTILSYAFILLPLLLVIGFVLRCFRL